MLDAQRDLRRAVSTLAMLSAQAERDNDDVDGIYEYDPVRDAISDPAGSVKHRPNSL
jgi:hypothetical protein